MADRELINLTNRLELVNEQLTEVQEVIDQEETLIEALRTRGRSTRKAEELLGLFQEISSLMAEHKRSLENAPRL